MNKLTKLTALFLAGAMLVFTGCSDYDDDIDAVNKRIDELATGKIATLEEQATALKSSLSSLEAAYKAADTELKNQLAKQLDDLTKADDALQSAIDKVKTDLTAKHDQDVQTLRNEISKAVGDLTQALNTAKSELEGKITGVNDKLSSLDGKVENYNTTLTNAINKVAGDLTTVSGKLTALEGTVDALSSKHDADVAALKTEIVEKVAAAKTEVLAQLASDKAELQGQITAAVGRIEALEGSVQTIQGQITAIEGQISSMQTAIAGKVDKSDFDAYTRRTDAAIQANAQALGVLNALCAGFPEDTTIKGYIDAAISDVTSAVSAVENRCTTLENNYTALSTNFGNFKANIEPRVKANEDALVVLNAWKDEMTKEDGTIDQLEARIQTLESNQLTLDDVNAQFSADVAEFKSGVDAVIAQTLAADGAISAAIAAKANELTQTFNGQFNTLAARVDAIELDLDELMNRIQSLVYVPEFNDHKASVNALYYAPEGEEPILLANGTVKMTFRVTPVEAAAQLVAAYAADPAMFSLEMEQVKTRAAAPALTIEAVESDPAGNGRFIVTALPAAFAPEFFAGKVSYSVALRVNKAYAAAKGEAEKDVPSGDVNADVVSDYVNLVPAGAKVTGAVLAPAQEDGEIDADRILTTDGEWADEIPYDETEKVVELLKGYELWFAAGDAYLNFEQLTALGYELEAPVAACTSTAYKGDGTAFDSIEEGNFEVANVEADACDETVKLIAADKTSRNNYLLTKHTYTIAAAYDELNPTFTSRVTIIKTKRGVTLEPMRYFWTYSDFLPIYEAGSEYEGSEREFTLKVASSTLPQDIGGEAIVTYWNHGGSAVVKAVELDAEGKPTETVDDDVKVVPVAYDAEEGYTLRVSGYTFGKSYAIEMVSELVNIQVTIAFNAEFVALPEMIEITLPEAELEYDATKEFFVSESTAVADELFEQVKDHFADATEFASSINREYLGGSPNSADVFYKATCGDRMVTDNHYWFIDSSNPQKITRIAVLNEAVLPSFMQVKRTDVETDADAFAFETKLVPNYGMPIYVKGEAKVEIPAYAVQHVDAWVYNKDGKWQSDVKGLWTPNILSSALTGFSVADIELESAFVIVKSDAQGNWVPVSADEIAEQNLAVAYEIPAYEDQPGLKLENNKLSYVGYEEFVPVAGTLSIDGIVISNAFSAVNDYTSYVVNKFDPIRSFTQEEVVEIPTRTAEAAYRMNICEVLSLRDKRDANDGKGYELIDHVATLSDPWITGDDANGFATGVRPSNEGIFKLGAISIGDVTISYADNGFNAAGVLGNRVQVNKATGEIVFSNLNNLTLQKDIDVKIPVTVTYPWAKEKSGTVTYKILK